MTNTFYKNIKGHFQVSEISIERKVIPGSTIDQRLFIWLADVVFSWGRVSKMAAHEHFLYLL